VEIVTGVNLPMLIKLAQVSPEEPLASVARMLRDTGQSSIYIASELLAPKKQA
jgi:mannose/fructose-specific phosphotransferase system component IIA